MLKEVEHIEEKLKQVIKSLNDQVYNPIVKTDKSVEEMNKQLKIVKKKSIGV